MSARIYVGRLSSRASERDIEHFFRGYGRIRDIVLKNGFGFVVSAIRMKNQNNPITHVSEMFLGA